MPARQGIGTWLWVTRPQYYQDADGNDADHLDPSLHPEVQSWWTCHKDTHAGDLVLLWRTVPRCDIGYLLRAESDAFSVLDDPDAAATWDYACEYRVLYKFQSPVTKKDLDHIPQFQDWRPHRGRFQRRAFRIDDAYWQRLTALLSKKNPGFAKNLKEVEGSSIAIRVALEEELESILAADLGRLSRQGYDLELVGRQLVCPEIKSRIDLLCRDRSKKRFVVVELKNERAGRATFSQIWSYMSWVKEHRSGGKPVLGLVISRGADNQFLACLRDCDNIRQVDLKDLGFE